MKILITGAAGFLGSEIVRRAQLQGHSVRAHVRSPSHCPDFSPTPGAPPLDCIALDLRQAADSAVASNSTNPFAPAVQGIDAVIHCAAITSSARTDEPASRAVNVEATRQLYLAARDAGVQRWIQISSMSAHSAIKSVYGRTKFAADEFLRTQLQPAATSPSSAAELPVNRPAWTILRPSLIYGPGHLGLVEKTTKLIRKLPFVPIVGSGQNLLRPVYVTDVAEAALTCLTAPQTIGQTYMLGGLDEVTLNDFMKKLAAAAGTPRPLFHLPTPLAHVLAKTLELLLPKPPITVDNVLGVKDLALVEQSTAIRDFAYAPRSLADGLTQTFSPHP